MIPYNEFKSINGHPMELALDTEELECMEHKGFCTFRSLPIYSNLCMYCSSYLAIIKGIFINQTTQMNSIMVANSEVRTTWVPKVECCLD